MGFMANLIKDRGFRECFGRGVQTGTLFLSKNTHSYLTGATQISSGGTFLRKWLQQRKSVDVVFVESVSHKYVIPEKDAPVPRHLKQKIKLRRRLRSMRN